MIELGYDGWMLDCTQDEIDNCICCEWDGKGLSCCGFPCPVHNDAFKELERITKEKHPVSIEELKEKARKARETFDRVDK